MQLSTGPSLQEYTKVFLAFCDETRLKVLDLLKEGEKSATALQELIGIGQSTLSHHMKVLVESGVISARKLGKWTYYSICESGGEYASRLIQFLTAQTGETGETAETTPLATPITYQRRTTNMGKFKIVADSSCDLPREYLAEHDIELMPFPLMLNDVEYNTNETNQMSSKEFYDALRNGDMGKTSLINTEAFLTSYKKYAEANEDAIYIILSSGLSGTYQAALLALDEVKESHPNCKIFPVDSISATSLCNLLIKKAVQKREEGLSAQETAAVLDETKKRVFGFFTVDDLMFLHRGGRLSKLSAVGGSLLSIKPVLNILPDGKLEPKEKVRGRQAALKNLVTQFTRSIDPNSPPETVCIAHTDCEADAQKLAALVKEAAPTVGEVIQCMMSPVIGAHVGPGAVAIVFEGAITRAEFEETYYKK